MSQLIEILSRTIHASVQAVLPDYALRMPPYTEETLVTLSGKRRVSIAKSALPRILRSTASLAQVFVVLIVSFVGVHAQGASTLMSPIIPMTALDSVASSSVASSVPLSPVPTLMSRMTKEQRLEARKKAAMNRTPLHSAAPIRLAPTTLNQRGVYLTAPSIARTEFFDDTLDRLKNARGSAVVFDVKGGGVLYHSGAPDALELGLVRSIYDLPAVIEKLHAQGFEVIGRFVAIKDEAYTKRKPETRPKHPVTGKVLSEWVDPANEDAIRFNTQVICELAASGIDEINLDYIRNSGADGTLYGLSREDKVARLEKFISAARDAIDRCGPKTRLGLSTYAILGWSYDVNVETIGQDVVRFAPYVDVISPMAYPATFAEGYYYNPAKHPRSRMYYLVYQTLMGYKELLGPEHAWKIRPWIQGYGVTTKNMADQMDAVFDAGSCGFLVWNANNNYAPTYAAMTADTEYPERCGIVNAVASF